MAPYVPPHLRNLSANKESDPSQSTSKPALESAESEVLDTAVSSVSLNEITRHYWPATEPGDAVLSASASKTMHDSAAAPGKLAYVLLFHGANPRWDIDNIIYTKSSLELLSRHRLMDDTKQASVDAQSTAAHPEVNAEIELPKHGDGAKGYPETAIAPASPSADDALSAALKESTTGHSGAHEGAISRKYQAPIAVFKATKAHTRGRVFQFEGFFDVERVEFLAPRSKALVRMLEQKFECEARDARGWERSMSIEWAVIKLAKNDSCGLEAPKMKARSEFGTFKGEPTKSVNELLAEMRLGGSKNDGIKA